MEQFLRIGVITSTHGVRGEVKVYPTTDSALRFREVKNVILKAPKGDIKTEITGVRFFKNLAIVRFACFDNVDQVQGMSGTDIMIAREDAQPLEEGEYYIADLLGMKVMVDAESLRAFGPEAGGKLIKADGSLGTVKDVLQTGANDVYLVDTGVADPKSKSGANIEALLPVIKQCILNVDIEGGVILAHIMPGLLDL